MRRLGNPSAQVLKSVGQPYHHSWCRDWRDPNTPIPQYQPTLR